MGFFKTLKKLCCFPKKENNIKKFQLDEFDISTDDDDELLYWSYYCRPTHENIFENIFSPK